MCNVLSFEARIAAGIFKGPRPYQPFFLFCLLFSAALFAKADGMNSSAKENKQAQHQQQSQQPQQQPQSPKPQTQAPKPNINPCQHLPGQSPEMVVIPGGEFVMGSPSDEVDRVEDEGPQHKVWVQPFALGRCEVTVAEFAVFVAETGYQPEGGCFTWNEEKKELENKNKPAASWRNPGFKQSSREPVACVSWTDARSFLFWLSLRTGVSYRLPTEAEWEYAARAGTNSPFGTGDCINSQQANFDSTTSYGNCVRESVFLMKTSEVGIYPPNPFGLNDIQGNVWEWTQDCWHETYNNAPENGSAWLQAGDGDCTSWVLRGGSWSDDAGYLRTAYRLRNTTYGRSTNVGFRLARTLATEATPAARSATAD